MPTYIALLRGINVGKAKRIAMEDLRNLVVELGHENPRTILMSGNLIFEAKKTTPKKLSAELFAAIQKRFGFSSETIVISATELESIIKENPIAEAVDNPSRFLVAFVQEKNNLKSAVKIAKESWLPDKIAIGSKAAYLWCSSGILQSKMLKAYLSAAGITITTRNWATVLKIREVARA